VDQVAVARQEDSAAMLCMPKEWCTAGMRIIDDIDSHHAQPFRELPEHAVGDELDVIRHGDLGL
jgi:hypothetical protein